jgi:predicted nucleic acid-binding protein
LRLPLAEVVEGYVFDAHRPASAPDVLNVEVLHALRRFERRRELEEARSLLALEDLGDLPIARYPASALLERAWRLRHNITAYDAMYVALAEALDTPLITTDAHLAAAARDHTKVTVVLLE